MVSVWWLLATFALVFGLAWLARRFLPDTGRTGPQQTDPPAPVPDDLDYDPHIGDDLDLHGVPPREVSELVRAFVDDARARGRDRVRIIHGKGIGAVRARVRECLQRHPAVHQFGDAPPPSSWGATVVELREPGCGVDRDGASD